MAVVKRHEYTEENYIIDLVNPQTTEELAIGLTPISIWTPC